MQHGGVENIVFVVESLSYSAAGRNTNMVYAWNNMYITISTTSLILDWSPAAFTP